MTSYCSYLLTAWCYSSCRTLAASHIRLHYLLSAVFNLHLLSPIFLRSSSTLSIHLVRDFPSKVFFYVSVFPSYRRVPVILTARF
jgi:hypothetical protein